MAWNEPGGDKNNDPWGNRRKQDGPPDLDELIKKFQNKLRRLFGGKGGSEDGKGGSSGLWILILVGLVIWLLSGFFIVQPNEQVIVLRFGKPQLETVGPGPNWHLPYPIETIERVDVGKERREPKNATMLTKDRNLIIVEMAIAYKVDKPRDFKFSVRNPILTLQQSIDSALREVVGSRTFDDMLAKADGRQKLVVDMREQLQLVLKNYKTGIKITKISLKNLAPPESVQEAYVDANRANNDAQAEIEKAQKDKERSIRLAQGQADQILEKAKAYKAVVVEKARGKAKAFSAILKEYETAPDVTRTRLYIKMMEKKFGDSNKIFVKIKSGNALMYIPLDKYIQQSRQSTAK